MELTNYLFIIFCFLVVSGCVSDNGARPHPEEEHVTITPVVTATPSQNTINPGDCSSADTSGFQEPYVEFLSGETTKTVNYTFTSTCAGPAELTFTLVPVNNWNERDPVSPADWVNVSFEPSSFALSPSRVYTSEVTIRLTGNTSTPSTNKSSGNRAAFFYLKPSIGSSVQAGAEDWLRVQENFNYRSLHRPRWNAVIEKNNLVVHPGSGNQTTITLNTQSQGLDNTRYEIRPADNNSASVLEDNLLTFDIVPREFPTRSFRNYTSVLTVNAGNDLPPGTWQFTVVIHGKSLMEIPLRIENSVKTG